MLAARREPIFDHGAHNAPAPTQPGHAGGHAAPPPTGFTRFISGLQILGTVLGIPLGLASGYSIYHANFSVEARCQGLRGNIVSMLDKSADAATLRMLVRRDVLTFEQSCGSVDPNAVAAFKTLLARGKPAAPVAVAHSAPERPHAKEDKPAKEVRGAPKAAKVVHAAKELHRPAGLSDAKWLSAVREALVRHHEAEREPQPVAAPPVTRVMQAPATTAVVRPAPVVQPAPIMRATAAPAPVLAPAAAPQANSNHPVPPALIPDALTR